MTGQRSPLTTYVPYLPTERGGKAGHISWQAARMPVKPCHTGRLVRHEETASFIYPWKGEGQNPSFLLLLQSRVQDLIFGETVMENRNSWVASWRGSSEGPGVYPRCTGSTPKLLTLLEAPI